MKWQALRHLAFFDFLRGKSRQLLFTPPQRILSALRLGGCGGHQATRYAAVAVSSLGWVNHDDI
jgi:hypothetical protein